MILAFVQLLIFIAGCEYYVMNLLTVKKKKKKKLTYCIQIGVDFLLSV